MSYILPRLCLSLLAIAVIVIVFDTGYGASLIKEGGGFIDEPALSISVLGSLVFAVMLWFIKGRILSVVTLVWLIIVLPVLPTILSHIQLMTTYEDKVLQ